VEEPAHPLDVLDAADRVYADELIPEDRCLVLGDLPAAARAEHERLIVAHSESLPLLRLVTTRIGCDLGRIDATRTKS
jgi:hypothetical protein